MATTEHHALDLELALLRRGLDARSDDPSERCARCHRTPLTGERIYVYESDPAHPRIACELCRPAERREPTASRTVHGPEFGHTMRISDQRTPARPAAD